MLDVPPDLEQVLDDADCVVAQAVAFVLTTDCGEIGLDGVCNTLYDAVGDAAWLGDVIAEYEDQVRDMIWPQGMEHFSVGRCIGGGAIGAAAGGATGGIKGAIVGGIAGCLAAQMHH